MPRLNPSRVLLLLTTLLPITLALKFDLAAHPGQSSSKHERCIRNFVGKDTLVLVTAIVDGQKGDGQIVNMHVRGLALASLTLIFSYRDLVLTSWGTLLDQGCSGQ